jgi:hypothetical protein
VEVLIMRRVNIIGLLAALAIVLCWSAAAWGEWYDISARRQTGHGGVFGEIEDRLASDTRFAGSRFDVWSHEDVHILNSQISRSRMAFYLPGGKACVVPMTGLRVRDLSGVVPAQYQATWVYRLYFQGRPPSFGQVVSAFGTGFLGPGSILNNPALVPFDELSASTCCAIAQWERGQDTSQEVYTGKWLTYYCSLVVVHLRDRGYSHWRDLNRFVQTAETYLDQIGAAR